MIKRSILFAVIFSAFLTIVAFAATQFSWEQDQYGWRLKNSSTGNYVIYGSVTQMNDGTYSLAQVASSTPFGSRNNEIQASYYFKNGYMVTNAWMPYIESSGNYSWRYYGPDGKALSNTTTPDGYQVNELGFWVNNGVVVYDEAAKAEFQKIKNDLTVIPPANQGGTPSPEANSSGSVGTQGVSDSLKSMIVSCKASREQILNQLNAEGIPYEYNAKGALFFNDVGGFKYSLQFNEQDICNFSMYLTRVNSLENAVGLYKYSEKIYGNDSNFTEISSGFWGNALLSKVYHDRRGNYIILSVNEANGQYEFATSYAASL